MFVCCGSAAVERSFPVSRREQRSSSDDEYALSDDVLHGAGTAADGGAR